MRWVLVLFILLLGLLFCCFTVSASNHISFVDLDAPVLINATLYAGGSVDGSYYYKVVAVESTRFFSTIRSGKSFASNEIYASVNATHKTVELKWNAVDGAGGYLIYRSSLSGDENYRRFLNVAVYDDDVNDSGICTFNITSNSYRGNNLFHNISHGTLYVNGDISIVDLYDASYANGWGVVDKLDEGTYAVKAYIWFNGTTDWIDEEKTIIFYDGIKKDSTVNARFGRYSSGTTNRGCKIIFKTYLLNTFIFNKLEAYSSTFDWIVDWFPGLNSFSQLSFQFIRFYADSTFINCHFNKIRGLYPGSSSVYMKNIILADYDIALSTGLGTYENIICQHGSRVFQTGTNNKVVARDIQVNSGRLVLFAGKNSEVWVTNTITDPSKILVIPDSTGSFVNENFTAEISVNANDSSIGLAGADVTVYDKDFNVLYSGVTDGNGVVDEFEIKYRRTDIVISTKTSVLYQPYTINISKVGYDDCVVSFNVTECVHKNMVFSLYTGGNDTVGYKGYIVSHYSVPGFEIVIVLVSLFLSIIFFRRDKIWR